jgi:predicted component of type VI protein secretion system
MAHRTCTHPLFEEPAGDLVSGNPAYAIGMILLDSAARTGSFTDIGGISAARITVLSAVARADGAIRFPPLQTRLPPATVSALLRSGISVLSANDETPFFPGLVSLAFALASERQDGHDQERLSYLFMVLRMAHCLKVVGREAVGSNASVSEVDATLSKWLRQFVSDVEHPATALRARRPLRQAAVQVHEEQGRPGVFAVTLKMVPHSHHLSANGELSVSLLVGG